MAFSLPALPYSHDALEPAIDAQTMQIHHGKHHQAYVNNLNAALEGKKDLQSLSLEQLLADNAAKVPQDIRQAVINNGGGHYNHSLFWTVLATKGSSGPPSAKLAKAIDASFGSLASFKEQLEKAGVGRFGSGWAWLVKGKDGGVPGGGKLALEATLNQDTPIMAGKTPIFGVDVWEHAYYLKYQNRRADYLKAVWDVVNWSEVSRRFGG